MRYKGHFKENEYHGIGKKYDYCGKLIVKANFNKGKLESPILSENQMNLGYNMIPIKEKLVFIGEEFNGQRNGFGLIYNKDKALLHTECMYVNGKLHGFCKRYHIDNENHSSIKYIGYNIEGWASDLGSFYSPNGKLRFRGIYKLNEPDDN